MKIMLLGAWERRDEFNGYARDLQESGHEVVSRWLAPEAVHVFPEGTVLYDEKGFSDAHAEQAGVSAGHDMEDTFESEVTVLFTVHPQTPILRGAHHTEFGMAMGWNAALAMIINVFRFDPRMLRMAGFNPKRLIVVGPRQNIYHCLHGIVEVFPTWEEAREAINASSAYVAPAKPTLFAANGEPL